MKRTAKAELRATSVADLAKQAEELRAQLFKGRIAGAVEGKSLGGKARQFRRQIARLQTIIGEKNKAAPQQAAPAAAAPKKQPTKQKAKA
jgi:ribosomal protein L29